MPMVVRRRGMGLIGTAAVAGGAYAAGKSRGKESEAEQARAAQQAASAPSPPAPAPPPAAAGMSQEEKIAALKQLAELKQTGVLTEEEFEREKQKILAL